MSLSTQHAKYSKTHGVCLEDSYLSIKNGKVCSKYKTSNSSVQAYEKFTSTKLIFGKEVLAFVDAKSMPVCIFESLSN